MRRFSGFVRYGFMMMSLSPSFFFIVTRGARKRKRIPDLAAATFSGGFIQCPLAFYTAAQRIVALRS